MKELYLALPDVLRKQIVFHFWILILAIVLFFIVLGCFADLILALPCLFLCVFSIIRTGILFCHCAIGNYLALEGQCINVEKTAFQKRIKTVTVKTEGKELKLRASYDIRNVNIGDQVTVYLSKSTPIYMKDGTYIANNFYGICVSKE